MEKKHKLNLIRLALHLLRNEKDGKIIVAGMKLNFNMRHYFSDKNYLAITTQGQTDIIDQVRSCGTSCCAFGDWILLKNPKERCQPDKICDQDFGFHDGRIWEYLFGCLKPNDVLQFAGRAMDVVRDHGLIYKTKYKSKAEAIRDLTYERKQIHGEAEAVV